MVGSDGLDHFKLVEQASRMKVGTSELLVLN